MLGLAAIARGPLRRVAIASVAFNASEWATWIAILVYAYGQGGALASGLVAFAQLAPAAIVAPIGASVVARMPRPLLVSYLAQALAVGATAVALLVEAPPLAVYALAAVAASTVTLTRPAQGALLPSLARTPAELAGANAALGAIENATIIAAPVLAGLLLGFAGPGLVFAVMAAALAAGAVVAFPIRAATAVTYVGVSRGLFTALAADRPSLVLAGLLGAQFLQFGALDVLIVVLALGVLNIGEGGVGLLNSALGVGGILGAAFAARVATRGPLAGWLVAGAVVWGVGLAAVAALPEAIVVVALLAVAGAGRSLTDTAGRTLLQRAAPASLLALLFGALEGLTMAALALGALLAPLLVAIDVRVAIVTVSAVVPAAALLSWRTLRGADLATQRVASASELLRGVPLFSHLDALELAALAREAEPLTFDGVVIRQGEPGDRFYVIEEGEAVVSIDGEDVALLGPGGSFGEIALLHDVPRTATVHTRGPARLLAVARDAFLRAVTQSTASLHPAELV